MSTETSKGSSNETTTYGYNAAERLTKQVRTSGTSTFTSTYQYTCK